MATIKKTGFRAPIISSVAVAAAMIGPAQAEQLEEVVVTAQKRQQSLQDVSLAVTALSSETIKDYNVTTIDDVQYLVPTIHMGTNFAFANIFIRGMGLNGVFGGIDPAVAVHLDGAVIAQPFEHKAAFFDLERIEVLRGPQGTLYGRNSTGGSINLITAKPTEELDGYVRGTVGGDDLNLIGEAAISGPVFGDRVLARAAVRYQNRDGYGEDLATGTDIDDADQLSFRGTLQFNMTDDIDLTVTGDYHTEDDRSGGLHFIRESFPGTTNAIIAATGAGGYATDIRDYSGDLPPKNERDMYGITATLNWQINDLYSAKAIINYRDFELLLFQDLDLSSVVNGTDQPNPSPRPTTVQAYQMWEDQFSTEFQVNYDGDRLNGVMGFFYFDESIDVDNRVANNPLVRPLETARLFLDGMMDVEAMALFANMTYDLTDQVAIKIGARYSYEKRELTQDFWICPAPGMQRSLDNCAVSFDGSGSRVFHDVTPSFGIEIRPMDNVMLFATYSEGFKSGTGAVGAGSATIVEPETIDNVEFGIKADWFDRTLRTNVNIFAFNVENAQFDRTIPVGGGNFVTVLENAASMDGHGVEFEGQWLVNDRFTIEGSASWSDIEFGSWVTLNPLDENTFPPAIPIPVNLQGNVPRSTPEWTAAIRPTYVQPLGNGGSLTWSGNLSYKSQIYYTEFNNPALGNDDYAILDAFVMYTSPDEKLTVNVWSKNLTDEEVLGAAFAVSTGRVIGGTWLPPRTYGVTVGYNFW